ncbi:hypothetical protein [Tsukamurella soli]|uniref:hypothetical protein n=1 Tax=Tsukamurella soli TaxID=644556 RepID=UPI0036080E5E
MVDSAGPAGMGGLDPAIRALLDRPVGEVLASLGLPKVPVPPATPPTHQLPATPKGVPEAPAVPGFDVGVLVKPMTDLLSTFGSGDLGGGAVDPSAVLSAGSKALEQGVGAGMQAVSALASMWQGPAATAAGAKGVQAATAGGLAAEQGAELSTAVTEAAAVVGEGRPNCRRSSTRSCRWYLRSARPCGSRRGRRSWSRPRRNTSTTRSRWSPGSRDSCHSSAAGSRRRAARFRWPPRRRPRRALRRRLPPPSRPRACRPRWASWAASPRGHRRRRRWGRDSGVDRLEGGRGAGRDAGPRR